MSTRSYAAALVIVAGLVGLGGCGDDSSSRPDAPRADSAQIDSPDAPPSTFDTCAAPAQLTFVNGIATAVADTAGATDDTAASCGGTGGPDVVYQFTTTSIGTLMINVKPTQGSASIRPVVSLRTMCSMANTEFGGCVNAASDGGSTLQVVRGLAAGTYYLWIDSADGKTASFDVSLQLAASAGDACSAPVPLAVSGETNIAASTTGSTGDEAGFCGGSSGLDNVFRIDLASLSNVEVTVTPKNAAAQPVVYLQQGTCGASDYACAMAPSAGADAVLRLGSVAPGTQFLWIDGANATSGNYNVVARITAPAQGDTCALTAPLTFTNGTAMVTGDTTTLFNDAVGSCSSGASPDAVYTFTTSSIQNFHVDVSTSSFNFRPAVYLRAASCTGSELGCSAAALGGGTGSLSIGALPVGTYYLWVDGAGGTSGPFTLNAALTTPTAGDTCTLAKALTFTSGTAADTGDTSAWFNDSTGTCASGTAPDGVYTFTTSSVQDFRVTVTTSTGTYQPAVYLRSASCTGTQLGCGSAIAAGGNATLDIGGLPIGTYYLWIDGVNGTAGAYSLAATLTNPLPAERCANPDPLVFTSGTAMATGDTTTMFNDAVGTCISGTAPDAVYSFTTASVQDLHVTVSTSTGTYQPAVYLRQASCTGTQLGCATALNAGATATLDVGGLAVGTYYLWIDGVGATAGAYTVTATLTTPLPAERCANPEPLVFSGGAATATGNTTPMFNDSVGTCISGAAPDAVYSFTTAAVQDLHVTVTTSTGTYQPAVYLRQTSCTGTQLGCSTAIAPGGSATLAVGGLAVGTYYLWIDGVGATAGAYTINATLSTPVSGERCANPAALTFTNGQAGGTATAMGDTTNMFQDSTGTCSGFGNDAVYSFTINVARNFSATVSTTTSTYRPVIYLRSTSCTGTQLGCSLAVSDGASTTLNVPSLTAGTYYVWVDSATTTGGLYTLSANLTALPPAEVRYVTPTNVTAPGPMSVTYQVVDAFGGVVTTDNATTFTVTVTGSAVITGATTGAILSGAGTNTVVVQVAGGNVTLTATDVTPETVTYTAVDTQPNGLAYPTGTATQSSTTQAIAATNTFNLSFAQRPSGTGTITVRSRGDYDASTEYLDVFMESTLGMNYGRAFEFGGSQCPSTALVATFMVPQSDLMTDLGDGVATIVTRPSSDVDYGSLCSSTGSDVSVTLSFPTSNTATFLP